MNFIFISPHFPPNYCHFCVALANHEGVNVLAIADEPYDALYPELKSALTEYYWVSDLNDYDQLLRACGFFTHKYGKIDRIDSLNEHWLLLEAKLRTDFNVDGPKIDQIGYIKHKSLMKQRFIEADIPVAPGQPVDTLAGAQAFIKEVGFPVVLKPDIGVGATDTYKISNETELVQFFAHKSITGYFMEAFIEGTICSFDGVTNRQGEPLFFTAHQYSQGVMDVVNQDDHVYYYSYRQIPQDLEALGRRILAAFEVQARFFHFEFFRTADNQLIALEVNMRPPGGLTLDMFNYANDIDIYREWANIVVNNHFEKTYHRPYHCAHVGRKTYKTYRYTHQAIMTRYGDKIAHYQAMPPLFVRAMGNYAYLVRTSTLDELLQVADFIQAT